VFSEAEEMAQRYREQIANPSRLGKAEDTCNDVVPFDNEAQSYANWKWLQFSKPDEAVNHKSSSEF
jgi:small subunit ribosomal protein S1